MTRFSLRSKKSKEGDSKDVKRRRSKGTNKNTQAHRTSQTSQAHQTSQASGRSAVTLTTIEESIKKYIYAQGLREQSWIVFDNLESILKDNSDSTNADQSPILTTERIAYIHAVVMTTEKLAALIEGTDGLFYTIRNNKKVKDGVTQVDSQVVTYRDLRTAIDKMPKSLLVTLRLVRSLNMKLHKYQSQPLPQALTYVGLSDDQIVAQLASQVINGRLTLEHNFTVTGDHLGRLSSQLISSGGGGEGGEGTRVSLERLTIHSCLRLRDFDWLDQADWVTNVRTLDLMVMSHLTMENVGYLVQKLTGLKELYLHRCPQINLRIILQVLAIDQLEMLCLDDPKLTCQPNAYSGVVSDKEWDQLLNKSLRTLFINSGNVSLDVIDFFRRRCPNLSQIIVCDGVYQKIKDSLRKPEDPELAKFTIVNAEQKTKMDLPRNFEMVNLLKQQFQAPFSDCMLKKMEDIRQQEMLED